MLLNFGADANAKCHGIPPLHLTLRTASLPDGHDFGIAAFKSLLQHNANTLAKVGSSVFVSVYELYKSFDRMTMA